MSYTRGHDSLKVKKKQHQSLFLLHRIGPTLREDVIFLSIVLKALYDKSSPDLEASSRPPSESQTEKKSGMWKKRGEKTFARGC